MAQQQNMPRYTALLTDHDMILTNFAARISGPGTTEQFLLIASYR